MRETSRSLKTDYLRPYFNPCVTFNGVYSTLLLLPLMGNENDRKQTTPLAGPRSGEGIVDL